MTELNVEVGLYNIFQLETKDVEQMTKTITVIVIIIIIIITIIQ